jgi:hypothetical protein
MLGEITRLILGQAAVKLIWNLRKPTYNIYGTLRIQVILVVMEIVVLQLLLMLLSISHLQNHLDPASVKIYVDDVLFHTIHYHLTKIFLNLKCCHGGTLVELLILPLINRLWKLIM